MAIGDVTVQVLPDARGFWTRFSTDTRGGADEAGRRAAEEFNRGFRSGANPTIRPRIDDAALRAELARLRAEIDRLNSRASSGANESSKSFSLLGTAIATLAPAAVTVGATAIGALAGIVPAAGTAVLAVLGIKDAFKSGALAGTPFIAQVHALQTEFGKLKATAAGGLIPGLTEALRNLQPLFGPVNQLVGQFAGQLGRIAASLAPALVSLFTRLQPLFVTFGNLLVNGAQHLAAFIENGHGMNTFIGYVQTTLPQVLSTLGSLITTIAHLSGALAPLGPVVLSGLGIIARVINAIPLSVLTGLATVVLTAYSAFQIFKGVVIILRAVNLAIESTPVGLIAAAAAAIAVFAFGMHQASAESDAATNANNAYAQSVQKSTDALNAANLAATNKALADSKSYELLDVLRANNDKLTVSNRDLVQGVNGSDAAFANLNKRLAGNGALGAALQKQLGDVRNTLLDNLQTQKDYNKVQGDLTKKLTASELAAQRGAKTFGTTTTAYAAAAAAAKKNTLQTQQQTLAFRLENDAASLLQQTLDKMAGRTLSTAEAQTALREANLQVAKSLHDNGVAVQGGSAKAVANQQALQGQANAAIAYAEAIGKATGSSKAEVAQLRSSRDAIEANLRQRGKLTPALKAYIDSLYNLSKIHVPPTKLDVETSLAHNHISTLQRAIYAIKQGDIPSLNADPTAARTQIAKMQAAINAIKQGRKPEVGVLDHASGILRLVQQYLNNLHDKTVTVTTLTRQQLASTYRDQVPQHATGGTVGGQGGPRSDNQLILASPGEEVIANPYASHYRGLLKAINAGRRVDVRGYATGGTVIRDGAVGSGPFRVGSQTYSTFTAAINAAQRVLQSQLNLKVKIDSSDIPAFTRSLSGTVASARAAFWTLLRDAQQGGLSKSAADYLHDEDIKLNAEIAQRNKIAATLAKVNAEIVNVRSAVTGSFDITTAGQGPSGNAVPQFGSILAQARQDENKVKQFTAGLRKLAAEGLGTTSLQQLAEAGPSALPQVLALERATPAQLRELNAARAAIYASGSQLGRLVGDRLYGVNSTALQGQEDALNRGIAALGDRIDGTFQRFAETEANRPVELIASGREIARVVNDANARNARAR